MLLILQPELSEWNDWGPADDSQNAPELGQGHIQVQNQYGNSMSHDLYAAQGNQNDMMSQHVAPMQQTAPEHHYQFGKKVEPEPEPEPDYFTDMQPEFKKAQKVICCSSSCYYVA